MRVCNTISLFYVALVNVHISCVCEYVRLLILSLSQNRMVALIIVFHQTTCVASAVIKCFNMKLLLIDNTLATLFPLSTNGTIISSFMCFHFVADCLHAVLTFDDLTNVLYVCFFLCYKTGLLCSNGILLHFLRL